MTRKTPAFAAVAVLLGLSLAPRTRTVVLEDGFLPPNDMKIAVGSLEDKGITQPQFEQVMDRIQALYGPVIAARGGKLVINRLWDNPTVNASAQRQGSNYVINMYGGLARHEAITQDGMALVACHEMGHHLGGAPKYGGADWASNEGQADYFANLKCLRRVFAAESSFSRPKGDDAQARQACSQSHAKPADQALCLRGAMAGMSVTSLLRALRGETKIPRFDTPDPAVVTRMFDGHPATQCRLDTYFSGSLCARALGDALDENDPAPGTCTRSAGYSVGLRPRCWYKPPTNEPSGEPEVLAARPPAPQSPALLSALALPDLWKGL